MNARKITNNFNLSAFLLTWIWGFAHKLYFQSFITLVLFILIIPASIIFVSSSAPLQYIKSLIWLREIILLAGVAFSIISCILWGKHAEFWLEKKQVEQNFKNLWLVLALVISGIYYFCYVQLVFFLIIISMTCTLETPSGCP